MNAAERLDMALEQVAEVAQRIEKEIEQAVDAEVDWEILTSDEFIRAKEAKKSDAWAERLIIKKFPEEYRNFRRVKGKLAASEKVSKVLDSAIRGYQTQRADERLVTR